MSNITDSHCHLQHPQYDNDREEVINRTLAANCGMICVGNDWQSSKQAIELANKYDGVWATVGSHPTEDDGHPIEDFRKLIKNGKRIVAIGEIGLDYYRTPEPEKRVQQKEMFLKHLELAKEFQLPLIIHCRSAHEDMLSIIRNSSLSGVVHSFTGTLEEVRQYIDLGFYIGLNGIITFTEDYNEMVRQIPLEKTLLETDAPYLAPVPYRGKRNEPLWVTEVAKRIAEIKKVDVEEIIKVTTQNTINLFKLS